MNICVPCIGTRKTAQLVALGHQITPGGWCDHCETETDDGTISIEVAK